MLGFLRSECGRGRCTRRSNPTRFCTSDADVKINNSFRRRRVWSERRESQMRLTLGIVNVRSTLQNIISPPLPPRSSWKPSRFGWGRPFPRRQQSGLRAWPGSGRRQPRQRLRSGRLAAEQSRCRAEGRAVPSSGVSSSSSLSCRMLDGRGSARSGRQRLARHVALILSGRGDGDQRVLEGPDWSGVKGCNR